MAIIYDNTLVFLNNSGNLSEVNGIISSSRWYNWITYSDPNSIYDYDPLTPLISYGDDLNNFSRISALQLTTIRSILEDIENYDRPAMPGFSVEAFTNLNISYYTPIGNPISNDGVATIRVANNRDADPSSSYGPSDGFRNGDVFFGSAGRVPLLGTKDYFTVLRELGKALGLKYANEAGPFGVLSGLTDTIEYTVMASRSYAGAAAGEFAAEDRGFARTFMMYDIAALQHLYGADYSANSGDTVYTWNWGSGSSYVQEGTGARVTALSVESPSTAARNRILQTIWDGGGNDTYDLSNYSTNLVIDLAPGGHSTFSTAQLARLGGTATNPVLAKGNVFNALLVEGDQRSLIENAIGSVGSDRISGNAAANRLVGNAGNDTLFGQDGDDLLDGGTGNDVMDGGAGNDKYLVHNVGDVASESGLGQTGGDDTVDSSVSYTLGSGIERLYLKGSAAFNGSGNDLANFIYADILLSQVNRVLGLGGNDVLASYGGNDVLDGGSGVDRMEGGTGNDIYYVDNVADTCEEAANGGTDTVFSSASYSLSAYVERLTLTGLAVAGAGNELANIITGNMLANVLNGGGGNDTLTGGDGGDLLDGRTGSDNMTGGAGDDIYVVDAAGDVIVETATGGIDTVRSSVSRTLGSYLENLVLTNGALVGTGNSLNNVITGDAYTNTLNGSAGADILIGGSGNDQLDGGTGVDRLEGGTGDDTYVADVAGDVIVEAAFAGVDTLVSAVAATLQTNIENLTLSGTAIAGTGNAAANRIFGNASANQLFGLGGDDTLDGGAGGDRLEGGAGNDTYMVDHAGDIVVETDTGLNDTVWSSRNYILSDRVESLVLTSSAILGTGNADANALLGSSRANTLTGLDGADSLTGGGGVDVLIGGGGNDSFVFTAASDSSRLSRDIIRAGSGTVAFENAGVASGDVIELSAIDADTEVAGDQAFVFGTSTGKGRLWVVTAGSVTHVRGNTDSDADFEFALEIEDAAVLATDYVVGDFIL